MFSIAKQKKELRRKMISKRNSLPLELKNKYDKIFCEVLISLIETNNYKVVHTYIPMGSEVNLNPFICYCLENNITLVAPKTLPNRKLEHYYLKSLEDIALGIYDAPYPINTSIYKEVYELILVPGLAFDQENFRLGYGGGYYDTFLEKHKNSFSLGLAYPFQILSEIPRESHDAQINKVITPI